MNFRKLQNTEMKELLLQTVLILNEASANPWSKHPYFHWLQRVNKHIGTSLVNLPGKGEEINIKCSCICHLSEYTIQCWLENTQNQEYICYHTANIPYSIIDTNWCNSLTIMFSTHQRLLATGHCKESDGITRWVSIIALKISFLYIDIDWALVTLMRLFKFFYLTYLVLTKAIKELLGITLPSAKIRQQ